MGERDEPERPLLKLWLRLKSGWGWLLLGLSALGGSSFIQHEIQPFLSVWQIIWATLPLTAAVAILTILALTDKLSAESAFAVILGTCAASVATGATAGRRVFAYLFQAQYNCFPKFASSPQLCDQTPDFPHASGNPVGSILSAYVHLYGVAGFISALLVGAFLGWAIRKLAAAPTTIRAGQPAEESAEPPPL